MQVLIRDMTIQFPGMEEPLLHIPEREVRPGARLLIRGPSGTGKTSLLHILGGLMDTYAGQVEVDGQTLSSLREGRRCQWRRERVGMVFQRLNLIGHLTALENVLLGGVPGQNDRTAARHALHRMGLSRQSNSSAWHLSLGEQQRVAVARVIYGSPHLILADEPTSSLDDANATRVVLELLGKVPPDGILIVSTHDQRIVPHFSHVWTIEAGEVQ